MQKMLNCQRHLKIAFFGRNVDVYFKPSHFYAYVIFAQIHLLGVPLEFTRSIFILREKKS